MKKIYNKMIKNIINDSSKGFDSLANNIENSFKMKKYRWLCTVLKMRHMEIY